MKLFCVNGTCLLVLFSALFLVVDKMLLMVEIDSLMSTNLLSFELAIKSDSSKSMKEKAEYLRSSSAII